MTVLICGIPELGLTETSVPGRCMRCRRSVGIAPPGQRLLSDEPGTEVVCILCGLIDLGNTPPSEREVSPAPGVARDMGMESGALDALCRAMARDPAHALEVFMMAMAEGGER